MHRDAVYSEDVITSKDWVEVFYTVTQTVTCQHLPQINTVYSKCYWVFYIYYTIYNSIVLFTSNGYWVLSIYTVLYTIYTIY